MKAKNERTKRDTDVIADPDIVLKAATEAPRVFNIASYFKALYVMREKGHSWRYLSDWLTQFNIGISHVHLHRLYIKEDERLSKLSVKELLKLGMSREMIEERMSKDDPTGRLVAPDPDDDSTDNDEERK